MTRLRDLAADWRAGLALLAAFPATYILSLAACAAVRALIGG